MIISARKRARQAAHALLDRAKSGEPVTASQIVQALRTTGDLAQTEHAVQITTPAGGWERKHAALMRPASWFDPIH